MLQVEGYQKGRWTGLLDGVPASTKRAGWTDSIVRLSVNLYGPPPLAGKEYARYRSKNKVDTIVGAGLVVHFPTGEYMSERLVNLGTNRYTIRPQLGVVHTRHNWTFEAGVSRGPRQDAHLSDLVHVWTATVVQSDVRA